MRKNCSSDLRTTYEIRGWRLRICKIFEITRTIYLNGERSDQFFKQNFFFTCSWRFLRSNLLEQLKFKLEKIIGIQKSAGKVRKYVCLFVFTWLINSWKFWIRSFRNWLLDLENKTLFENKTKTDSESQIMISNNDFKRISKSRQMFLSTYGAWNCKVFSSYIHFFTLK